MKLAPRRMTLILIAVCLLGLAFHRYFIFHSLKIAPDPGSLVNHWQHLALDDLATDLTGSLLMLQSQPPLWNGLVGLAAKACDGAVNCTADLLHGVHVAITMILFVLVLRLGDRLINHRGAALAIAMGFCLSPSVIYYENYTFYPHLTALFFAGFALGLLRWIEARSLTALLAQGVMLAGLAWSWTLFHPVFVGIVLGASLIVARPLPRGALTLALGTLLIVLLPSMKNQLIFGQFAAGSWLGLNLAQVAPGGVEGCGFGDFLDANDLTGIHLGTAFNDPRIAAFSDRCKTEALERIRAEPLTYMLDSTRQLLSSLSMRPHDYIFNPLNWDRYPLLVREWEIRGEYGQIRPGVVATRLMVLGFNLLLAGFLIWRALRAPDPVERRFLAVMLVFVMLFLALAHAVNGAEQERMRYTLHPFLWLYAWLMLGVLFRGVRARTVG